MSDTLSGKVVLITGATGALGSVVTREFTHIEASLALTGRSEKKLTQLSAEIDLPAKHGFATAADATQTDAVDGMVTAVVAHFGQPIDVLLNIIGGWSGGKTLGETPVEDWDRMLALNLRSAFLLSRAVLPSMLETGWGRIIHVSSKTATAPRAKQAAYAVSKMGLIALTQAIAVEVKGSGVTANVILPSIIDTPANRKFMPKATPEKWVPPEHIAATMRYLCSEEAASINGASIPIYGAV
jgi:NAD(P)-dependent dehydrogenase (short-subunit alcohol dehydrogenase family)